MTTESFGIFFTLIILFNSFEPTVGRNIVNYLTLFFGTTCITINLFQHESLQNFVLQIVVGSLLITFVARMTQQVNIGSIENFIERKEQTNMFENIVQNIEDSLVIFEDSKMYLVNPQFLKLFKNVIIDIKEELEYNGAGKDQSQEAKKGILQRMLSKCCIKRVRDQY